MKQGNCDLISIVSLDVFLAINILNTNELQLLISAISINKTEENYGFLDRLTVAI